MAKPSGEIIERPILSSFREGLTVLEYFISTHGARKGLADTALKTADAGYLTRKLCDVAMDVIITEEDCGTRDGIWKKAIFEGDDEMLVSLAERIVGRFSATTSSSPQSRRRPSSAPATSSPRSSPNASTTPASSASRSCRRSPPPSEQGIDAKSYGINPATNKVAKIGDSVGIIAAQSIGEPGTQLTMRTFHIGGVASGGFKNPEIKVRQRRYRQIPRPPPRQTAEGHNIVLNKTGSPSRSSTRMIGARVLQHRGRHPSSPSPTPRRSPRARPRPVGSLQHPGPLREGRHAPLQGHDPGVTVKRELDESTGRIATVVIEHKEDLNPQIEVRDDHGKPARRLLHSRRARRSRSTRVISSSPVRCSPRPRVRRPRPRTSPVVFRAWPSSSKPAARRKPPRWPASTASSPSKAPSAASASSSSERESGAEEEHLIPPASTSSCRPGDVVHKGQHLTEGSADPHEILEILGPTALYEFLISRCRKSIVSRA
jgi:DNA-directed RNA polymerase subunit beta'